jgi:hypothetical protein
MGKVLSIDLAYKKARDFGICLLEEQKGRRLKAEFIPPHELINDPPEAAQCAQAIFQFCKKHRARVVLLDGPQGWKDPESPLPHSRHCEKILRTPGKTGTVGRAKPGNYTRFIGFSIGVFANLVRLGGELVSSEVVKVPKDCLLVVESFPTSAWRKLGIKPLPGKAKRKPSDIQDRLFRLQELLRFRADREPTHDELEALVAGVAGVAILAGKPSGYWVQGSPPREVDGVIVEGLIVNPCIERLAA